MIWDFLTFAVGCRANSLRRHDGDKPLLTGSGEFAQRPLYWEHEGNAAIRVNDRKLVRQGVKGTWELFDLKTDRTEQQDLASEHPDEVAALAKQWNVWARDSNVLPRPAARGGKRKKRN